MSSSSEVNASVYKIYFSGSSVTPFHLIGKFTLVAYFTYLTVTSFRLLKPKLDLSGLTLNGDRIEDSAVGSSLDMSDVLHCPVISQTVCLSKIIFVWWIFC